MFQMLMADGAHAALAGAGGWLIAFAQIAAPVAVAAFWQGAAIALVLWVGLGLMSRVKIHLGAAQRFGLWAAAFAVVIGLQFLPWFAHGTVRAIAANALPAAAFQAPRFQIDDRWAFAIAGLWLAASLARIFSLAVHALQLRRLWNSASPVATDEKLSALLAGASPSQRTLSRKVAEICTTRKLDRPAVIGFLAPRILIPELLLDRLTPAELEQVVLHEAEHLRRRDDWSNLFQKLALVLFPLNPALAWIESRLCREREMACDEGVVRRTHEPRAYAECLTSLAERRLELRMERRRAHALSLGAFERRPELVRRVYSILSRKQALHPFAARALVGVAGCCLLVASVELARCPQMVAFVPAAQNSTAQAVTARTDAMKTDAMNLQRDQDRAAEQPAATHEDSGFRVVETKAILPSGRRPARFTPGSSRPALEPSVEPVNASPRQIAAASETPREVLLRAEMPDATAGTQGQDTITGFASTPKNVVPQYVVLTAWEEVRTSPRNARIVADYDTNAAEAPQSAETADPHRDKTVTRITITEVIFAMYPVSSGPNGSGPNGLGPHAKPAHAEDSDQPPAPLPESGWLVFQL